MTGIGNRMGVTAHAVIDQAGRAATGAAVASREAVAALAAGVASREAVAEVAGVAGRVVGRRVVAYERCQMGLVSAEELKRVTEAIATAEGKTSGEIVAVIAPQSARYLHIPFLWGGLAALLVPIPLIYWTWLPIQQIYFTQIAVFAAVALVLAVRPFRLVLVPRSEKHHQAHRRAVEQFLAQNLHTTPGRTGVLIFISVAERFAEILADDGIHKRVPESAWQTIVNDLTGHIGRGQAGKGLVEAIETAGGLLADHFPPGSATSNALPNHLIVLPPDDTPTWQPLGGAKWSKEHQR
jgi:putative membrane protein